jgi:cyclopropane-fatty-acyl-phospholipid synthase
LFPLEAAAYGLPYAGLRHLIRSPRPLDAESTWKLITEEKPPLYSFVCQSWPLAPLRSPLMGAKMRQDHILGIADHYDISNEFYELFLDKRYMFYTCADFHSDTDTLEDAQQHKADFILRLIDPQPQQEILELGCGWGAMLKRIYEQTGNRDHLHGLTLSKEQVAYNEQHNGFHVDLDDFITRDYPDEFYDTIYSIGAWEHVRPKEVAPLSKRLFAAIKPGGKLVQHFFCRMTDALFASAICSQIYFPGSLGSSYRAHVDAFEGAGFRITHRSVHDYRPTLRAWFDNLVANRERALQLVDVATYNRHLTFFPVSWRYFNDGVGMLVRWVLEKPVA